MLTVFRQHGCDSFDTIAPPSEIRVECNVLSWPYAAPAGGAPEAAFRGAGRAS
jgi:hypothetical protein